MIWLASYVSPLGPMTLASDGECLTGLWFDGQKYDRASLRETVSSDVIRLNSAYNDILSGNTDNRVWPGGFAEGRLWLDQYFAGQVPDFVPPLRVNGSRFRQLVAEIMLSIPYGQTMTYGEIGHRVAGLMGRQSMSAQAVGGAVGHNPISLIIPCHRVVGSTGSLTGYAGGLDRKSWLLRHEAEHSNPNLSDDTSSIF